MTALGISGVEVSARAIWTHSQGVSFAGSGDDAGHVAATGAGVPSQRLRDLIGAAPIELLKLDIEGGEFSVLPDCDGALGNVRRIVMEVHMFEPSQRLGELLLVLERNGFHYSLADLQPAVWLGSSSKPPFAACPCDRFLVTVFAWR